MAPEEKLKDPLVLLGLGSIFLPFVMILLFQATGVILCGNQIYWRVRPRYRRGTCSMAWRCRFLTARRSQRGHIIAEK